MALPPAAVVASPPPGPGVTGWLLVIVRIILLLVTLVASLVAHYALAPFTRHNPVPCTFLRLVTAIVGVRLRKQGRPPTRGETCILLSNHVSWLDIPALAGASHCAFVAHDGLAALGPMRWLCELNDTVFIARHDRTSVARQVAKVRAAITEAGALTLFPEGTTGDGQTVMPFKSSLLSALDGNLDAVPIRPVWLDYGRHSAEIAWLGEESGLSNALRILGRWRRIQLTVHFLDALPPESLGDRKVIARAARETIQRAMDRCANV